MIAFVQRILRLVVALLLVMLGVAGVSAFSGFPSNDYPGHLYGLESHYYNGPWGERMVYGSYGYFPNPYGYYPYGYRTYGYFYTPWDLRTGRTMGMTDMPGRFVTTY